MEENSSAKDNEAKGGEQSGSSGTSKPKSPLDKLSKEELLTKYKNLMAIAQKAKGAKDGE